jgi:hypothetical protein
MDNMRREIALEPSTFSLGLSIWFENATFCICGVDLKRWQAVQLQKDKGA